MPPIKEGSRKADFMISEANDWRSRDQVTVTVPANGLPAGAVLGQVTATKKFVRHNPAAGDGSETAAGLLFEPLTEPGDTPATNLARDAEVLGAHLTYADGATPAQIEATKADLAARGVIVR
jgi:hypothetical protein